MEVDTAVTQVLCENCHDLIKSQIVRPRISVPHFGFPENRKTNRATWVSCPNLSVLKNGPVAITTRLDCCRG